jgi:hypothetical protein
MRRLLLVAFLAVTAGACALDKLGTGADGVTDAGGAAEDAGDPALSDATVADAKPDTASPKPDAGGFDAGPDASLPCPVLCRGVCVNDCTTCPDQLLCGNTCVAGCLGCASGEIACGTTCVQGCAGCDAGSEACYSCTFDLPPKASATCQRVDGGSCSHTPAPCGCWTFYSNVGLCHGADEVCPLAACQTCGEPGTTGEICRDGGTCSRLDAGGYSCR